MPLDELKAYVAKDEGSYIAQMALGVQLRRAGDLDGAVAAFKKAAALVPIAAGDDSPNALHRRHRHPAARTIQAAIEALQAQMAVDFNNIDAARQLAALMRDNGVTDPARLEPVYRAHRRHRSVRRRVAHGAGPRVHEAEQG